MAARSKLGSLRATLAEEQSRLSRVLDQIDEALDCVESGASKELPQHEGDLPAAVPTMREAAQAGRRVAPDRTRSQPPVAAWDLGAKGNSQTKGDPDQPDVKDSSPKAKTVWSPTVSVAADPVPLAAPVKDGTASQPARVNSVGDVNGRKSVRKEGPRKSQRARQIFANADQMKEQVQKAILEPEYNVKNMYKDDGCWAAVARSPLFDISSIVAITLNALWLAVETDYNDEPLLVNADPPFIIVENFFCTCFCAELLIKFMAFSRKTDVLKDSWFVFDSVLVCFMAAETWLLSILVWVTAGSLTANSSSTSVLRVVRLFRMTRAARVARVLKAVPELMVIGHGIVIVARTVVVIFCVLFLVIYTFAIVFTQLAKGTDLEKNVHPNAKCSDMVTTMSTLLLGGILPDFAPTTEDFAAEDFFFAAFFFMFILLAYVTIMNMLIGVLVEVVAVVASVEKETNQVAAVKRVLLKWTPDTDLDGDCRIGVDEFKNMLNNDGCAKDLNDVGVDAIALIDHADFVYRNKTELTFAELLAVVLGLRGRNDPKVQDLVQLRKFLHVEMLRIEMSLESLHTSLGLAQPPPSGLGGGSAFGEGSGFGERNGFGWGKGCGGNGFGGGGNCDTSAPEPPVHNAASVW